MAVTVRVCPNCNHTNSPGVVHCTQCLTKLPIIQPKATQTEAETRRKVRFSRTTANFGNPGYYLDGWADLIEGKGYQAQQVESAITEIFDERRPVRVGVNLGRQTESLRNVTRTYTVTALSPGASTLIYVGRYGNDLYVSWKSFVSPVINYTTLLYIAGTALFLAALVGLGADSSSLFLFFLFLFGLLITGSVSYAGRILKDGPMSYFLIEPNLFDADNISAINLAVHKSILSALDKEGIDIKNLRLKREFKSGRRNEDL